MTKPLVYIVIYSLYHHVYKLSLSIKEGLESKGVEVKLFQVQETLSDEILSKMQAPSKLDLPIITVDKLSEPDGILFGLPTRFGTMPAQMKALLDASGALWAKGSLAGKFAGTFFSTASQHGGQETTALTAVTYFAHHGMLYVPFGYANAAMGYLDEVIGGSAYGCGTISDGDGSRQPTQTELSIAENQGTNFGEIITTFVKGRDADTTGINQNTNNLNGSTNPPVSSAVDNNNGPVSDINANTSQNGTNGSNVGAGVAGAGMAAAGTAAVASAVGSKGKRLSTTGDNTLRSTTDNNEITSAGVNTTAPGTTTDSYAAKNVTPSANDTNVATDGTGANPDNRPTGTNADLNSNAINPTTDTAGTAPSTDPTTGITPNNATGTPSTNVTDANATGTDPTSNVTGTNNLGDTAKAGAATAAAGAATAGATGAATGGATGAGATGAATNAATTAAGKSTGGVTNAIKESIVKGKGKDKPKKKKWFCC